jgi:hypothetical protein
MYMHVHAFDMKYKMCIIYMCAHRYVRCTRPVSHQARKSTWRTFTHTYTPTLTLDADHSLRRTAAGRQDKEVAAAAALTRRTESAGIEDLDADALTTARVELVAAPDCTPQFESQPASSPLGARGAENLGTYGRTSPLSEAKTFVYVSDACEPKSTAVNAVAPQRRRSVLSAAILGTAKQGSEEQNLGVDEGVQQRGGSAPGAHVSGTSASKKAEEQGQEHRIHEGGWSSDVLGTESRPSGVRVAVGGQSDVFAVLGEPIQNAAAITSGQEMELPSVLRSREGVCIVSGGMPGAWIKDAAIVNRISPSRDGLIKVRNCNGNSSSCSTSTNSSVSTSSCMDNGSNLASQTVTREHACSVNGSKSAIGTALPVSGNLSGSYKCLTLNAPTPRGLHDADSGLPLRTGLSFQGAGSVRTNKVPGSMLDQDHSPLLNSSSSPDHACSDHGNATQDVASDCGRSKHEDGGRQAPGSHQSAALQGTGTHISKQTDAVTAPSMTAQKQAAAPTHQGDDVLDQSARGDSDSSDSDGAGRGSLPDVLRSRLPPSLQNSVHGWYLGSRVAPPPSPKGDGSDGPASAFSKPVKAPPAGDTSTSHPDFWPKQTCGAAHESGHRNGGARSQRQPAEAQGVLRVDPNGSLTLGVAPNGQPPVVNGNNTCLANTGRGSVGTESKCGVAAAKWDDNDSTCESSRPPSPFSIMGEQDDAKA